MILSDVARGASYLACAGILAQSMWTLDSF